VSALSTPCVLVVADPGRISEVAEALGEPLSIGPIDVLTSTGGDDTIDLFGAHKPDVVIVTATLEHGDSKSLIEVLRGMVSRSDVGIVLIGDDNGPIKTAMDALDLEPDRFVPRPLAAKSLRFAVESCLDAITLLRGSPRTKTDRGTGLATVPPAQTNGAAADVPSPTREALRARWEALADSIGDDEMDTELPPPKPEPDDDILPLPSEPMSRERPGSDLEPWFPETAPAREPTLIIRDPVDAQGEPAAMAPPPMPPPPPRPGTAPSAEQTERFPDTPMPLAELIDDGRREPRRGKPLDEELAELDRAFDTAHVPPPPPHIIRSKGDLRRLEDLIPLEPVEPPEPPSRPTPPPPEAGPPQRPSAPSLLGGRDFARELRAKMSMMAQRLFHAESGTPLPSVEMSPRHDHKTEIDLASLGEEPALGGGVTEIEGRPSRPADTRELTTSPGSWDTQVRERGLPDSGEIVRGVSDAAMLVAKMFAQGATGRVGFRKDEVEKVVFFDQGRPVFASSNEPGDRMGELLVREGKITASQYERCQSHATTSGRRMGEILVDFGYLKRRELLPAVRRHVEDIIYSLFGWDHGHYHVHHDEAPSGERIRLSRHPASLVLEGIRRKLDRSSLERLVGPPSTVVEVPDREKLGGIVAIGDLAVEERASLAAFDGQADLAQVARTAGLDVADVLPLVFGLCVLGLANARRVESESSDEQAALVGETDLAIDRERVRARWQLVSDADYFALLGVRRDATAFEIRRAYQSARRDFAADCFPNDLRRELARELDDIASVLDEAFRVLRDDRLRVTYLSNLIE
jgi:DNA-binding NarL/FixJ family response regulator